jgi:hypothetical protein
MAIRRHRPRASARSSHAWVTLLAYGTVLALILLFGQKLSAGASGCMGELASPNHGAAQGDLGAPSEADAASTPPSGESPRIRVQTHQ